MQREAALGTASLFGDTEVLSQQATDPMAKLGVIGVHVVFPPHCFKYIHDAAGKVFSDNKNKGITSRSWTISNVYQHYDYNAATMQAPKNTEFNFDFSFHNYIHLLYKEESFIDLEANAVPGIQSWRSTEGGNDARATGRAGAGGGVVAAAPRRPWPTLLKRHGPAVHRAPGRAPRAPPTPQPPRGSPRRARASPSRRNRL